MDIITLLEFTAVIAFGTYLQTVTGFGLGMVVMGVVTALNIVPIAFTSVVISLVTFFNGVFTLKGNYQALDKPSLSATVLGIVPGLVLGLYLLALLSTDYESLLQQLLGGAIVVAGLMMTLKPAPLKQRSGAWQFAGAGALAGILAGMFSMAGPPLVFQYYRQPFNMKTIRLCLLAIFLSSGVVRTLMVGAQGELEIDMFTFTAVCMPVVYGFTWLGKHYPPPISDLALRRFAFTLLIGLGLALMAKGFF